MASKELARIEPGGYLALNQDPAEVLAIIDENIGGQEVGEFDLPRIKVPSGGARTWEIPALGGGVDSEQVLEGIVVHFKLTRAYWPPEQENGTPPACRSDNGIIGIGDPGGQCKTCPLAQFGSAVDEKTGAQRPGQACNAKEIWFMLRPGSFLPVVVALPATSLKAAKQYRIGALGSSGMRMAQVVTAIELEPARNADGDYAVAKPKVAGLLTPDEAKAAMDYAATLRPIFEAAAAAINTEDAGAGQPPAGTPPAPAAAGEPDEPADAQVVDDEPKAKAA